MALLHVQKPKERRKKTASEGRGPVQEEPVDPGVCMLRRRSGTTRDHEEMASCCRLWGSKMVSRNKQSLTLKKIRE